MLQAQLLCWCQQWPPRAASNGPTHTAAQVSQLLPERVLLQKHKEDRKYMRLQNKHSLGFYCLFGFFKAWLSSQKTLLMGSVLHCKTKFFPFSLSPVPCDPSLENQGTLE